MSENLTQNFQTSLDFSHLLYKRSLLKLIPQPYQTFPYIFLGNNITRVLLIFKATFKYVTFCFDNETLYAAKELSFFFENRTFLLSVCPLLFHCRWKILVRISNNHQLRQLMSEIQTSISDTPIVVLYQFGFR